LSERENDDFGLTLEDEKAIDEIIPQMRPPPTRKVAIRYVLRKWRRFVNQVAGTYKLAVWDFTNDFTHRDFLERVLKSCPSPQRRKLGKAVEELDRKFYESTYEIEHPTDGSKEVFSKEASP
jgi:hypothetical protein